MRPYPFISYLVLICTLSGAAMGQTSGGGSKYSLWQKAQRKAESRWTLQGWLEQRDKNRMMDLWLAMNSPSPYEFFLSGAYQDYTSKDQTTKIETHRSSSLYSAGAYSGILGLEAFHENNTEEQYKQTGGSLNLRIVGNAVQGTHLMINYGYRSASITENLITSTVNQSFAGADLNLYFTQFFGLSGTYRYYIPVENELLGKVSGNRSEAGAFLDFSFIRIFGTWFSDTLTISPNRVEKTTEKTGVMSGIKIFF
jgi:hypothetical protein